MKGGIAHGGLFITYKRVQYCSSGYENHDIRDVGSGPVDAKRPVVCRRAGYSPPHKYLQYRVANAIAKGIDNDGYEGDDVRRLEYHNSKAGDHLQTPRNQKDSFCSPPFAVHMGKDSTYEGRKTPENEGAPGRDIGRREENVATDRINYEEECEEFKD